MRASKLLFILMILASIILSGCDTTDPSDTVTSIEVTPLFTSVVRGTTKTFTAKVNGNTDTEDSVNWTVTGGIATTTINVNGILTVDSNETATSLEVKATYKDDNTKSGTAYVQVTNANPTVSVVTVVALESTVVKGQSVQFTAVVDGSDNPPQDVNWTVNSSVPGTFINSFGFLTVSVNEPTGLLTVTATSRFNTARWGTASVKVIPVSVTSITVSPFFISLAKGQSQTFVATINGTGDLSSQTVYWSVSGHTSETTMHPSTGLLSVGNNETAQLLTITATSTTDPTKTGTAYVLVTATT